MKKTFQNFVYQSIFQLVKIILPLITIPIVSNALGPKGIGVFNYTNSIVQYFVLLAGLGVGVYGNREIARVRDNKTELSKRFWEIFNMSFLVSTFSLVLYIIIVSFSDDKFYFYLQSLIIIGALFDISWFFMGIEDFKKSSLSSLVAQFISFLGIILFVKDSNDLWIYILIQSMNILISQVIMWVFIRKKITFIMPEMVDILKHVNPSLQYFIPKIAIILYTNLNKTLLGWLDTKDSVGYFTNTLIMNGILVTLVTTLDLVLLPRFSNLVAKGDTKSMLNTIKKSIQIQLFFTIAMMFGILIITPKLVPWFFGDKFLLLVKTIPIVSPLIVIIPLGMAVGRQYLVPLNRIGVYNRAVIIGAIVSIITNLILIPFIGIYGAIVATLLAELFVTLTRFTAFKKETKIQFDMKSIIIYIASGIVMYFGTTSITQTMFPSILTTLTQATIGFIIYIFLTTIMQVNPLINMLKQRKNLKI